MPSCTIKALIACAAVGTLGGFFGFALGVANLLTGPLLGAFIGSGFALLAGARATTPGAGLIWGLGYALALWLAGPVGIMAWCGGTDACSLDAARSHFPELAAYLLAYGLPLGVTLGFIGLRHQAGVPAGRTHFSVTRAVLVGSLAGVVGGWLFGHLPDQIDVSRLIAGSAGSGRAMIGSLVTLAVSALIGASFGLLFQRDVRGYGSCMGWGLAYGMLWWFLGPLTLVPLSLGDPPAWTHALAAGHFSSLVGHVCFGLLLGLVYATVDRAWVAFFYDSDPLNRVPEGPGTRTLQSLGWGALSGIAGGLVFSLPMLATGILPYVANLVGGSSPWLGFVIHLAISALIGMSYGLLFLREAPNLGSGVGWGLLYGLVWWFLGPLTLFPWLLEGHVEWTIGDAAAALPSLIGHLLYGATTAYVFMLLELRHAGQRGRDVRSENHVADRRRPSGTPAPALWFFAVGLGVLLPILLG